MLKKTLSLVMIIVVLLTTLAGCDEAEKNDGAINLNIASEPETIDPSLNSSMDGATYIVHFFEGLTKIGKNKETVPGVAEKWEISSDKTKYTFYLRDNAKWSDGQAVKAQDFAYAWKRTLTSETAASYASMLYYIKNGEDFYNKKAKAEDLGIKVIDDKTLEVTLKAPVTYFLTVLYHSAYMPQRQDIIEKYGNKWTQSPDRYVSNGAYKMKAWKHKDVLEMVKNNNYWDAKNIKIKQINWQLIEDANAALNAYEAGELDGVLSSHVPVAEIKSLMDQKKLKVYPLLGTYYLEFSVNKKPVDNANLRKALSAAIDREILVEAVAQAGQKPAVGMVPYTATGANSDKDFRSESGAKDFIKPQADIKKAKKLLSEAGYPGGKGLEGLEIIYNTDTGHQKAMEFIQEQWKKNLGVETKISNMEWKTLIPKRQAHDFIISRGGWVADYNDPMTFLDLFMQGNDNNDPDYNNEKYDSLIKAAQLEADSEKRMKLLHEAEAILMDDMPVIPLYYYVTSQLESPKLKGLVTSNLGYECLHYATFK